MPQPEQKLPYPTEQDVLDERAFWFNDRLTDAHRIKRPHVLLVRKLYEMVDANGGGR